jgi:hypothetical protein
MGGYHTMYVDRLTQGIIGDVHSPYFSRWNLSQIVQYTWGAITLMDPILFRDIFTLHNRLCKQETIIDPWLEICLLAAEKNRRRLQKDKSSIYNACVFNYPLIDYGTPEKLALTRSIYNKELLFPDQDDTVS